MKQRTWFRPAYAAGLLVVLAGCEDFDSDFRGVGGAFNTTAAAQAARSDRPDADDRGVISYPSYQVAVARRGDTVSDVATRVSVEPGALARFNGLTADTPLRAGEILALPTRVPDVGGETSTGAAPSQVDVTALAGQAIETAAPTPAQDTAAPAEATPEPIRHKVARGETAYSIARLYRVSVRDLARWNSLDSQFTVREVQYLLIPVTGAQTQTAAAAAPLTTPGQGSPTPTPPSADKPLPQETVTEAATPPPAPDLGAQTRQTPSGEFAFPVQGSIIRDYAKGRNEGIDIKGTPGAPVTAAAAGTVAAITESAEGVPIIVVRHDGSLLTVYANVTDVLVEKGDSVRRGQGLAKLRAGDQSFVHFEVRQGFDSVDPNTYLN